MQKKVENQVSHVWVRLFLEELKIVKEKNRTHAGSGPVWHLTTNLSMLEIGVRRWFFLVSKNFYHEFWFLKWMTNEFKDNNEKSFSWSRKRVSHKIDFKAESVGVNISYKFIQSCKHLFDIFKKCHFVRLIFWGYGNRIILDSLKER